MKMEQIRVLLIDDDEDDYILTRSVFDQLPGKYALSWVNNYDKGISAITRKQFDVYLLDYRLGKGTGLELLQEARNSGADQPIIMLTGNGDRNIDEQAMAYGAADYLVKDQIEPAMLERCIRYSLSQAETLKALSSSERKYRAIFEQAKEPIFISDSSGRIYDMNNGGLRFFQYQQEELKEMSDTALFHDEAQAMQFRDQLEKNGFLSDFECQLVSRDGKIHHCSISSFIQTDMISVSEVYHSIVRDLSGRKEKEARSVNLGKMAITEHIAKGLGEEIRDPLSTINLAIEELANERELVGNEAVQRSLEIVRVNCDRLNQLVQHFISSTETESLNLQPHHPREVIHTAIADMEELIAGHRIELTTDIHLPDSLLFDHQKVADALKVILTNAVEAMVSYPHRIHICASFKQGVLEISVTDNGRGVPEENRVKIFEPFFTTKKRANGLGLTHAQRMLTTHNGSVRYEPLDQGSLFIMRIPLSQQQSV